MKTWTKVLLTILAMGLVAGCAVGVNYIMGIRQEKKWEEERAVRLLEVTESTDEIRSEIEEISQLSVEEIQSYIEEHAYIEEEEEPEETEVVDVWGLTGDYVSGDNEYPEGMEKDSVSENDLDEELPEEELPEESVSENDLEEEEPREDVSGNDLEEGDVSGNDVSDNDLEGEDVSGNDVSGNDVSGNEVAAEVPEIPTITLKDRQKLRASYEETELWMEADDLILEEYAEEFEGLKVACLGDSITAAANLENLEDYQQYAYPTRLSEVLETYHAVNLGIGGSSYGRYWDNPFCERYREIPEDTELILVMGGTNDGFCLTEDLVGSMEERSPRTLYGDVNELMAGLKENYPDAQVVFLTPLPNLLHDILRKDREELLPQTVVVDCVKELAAEYGFPVIDLYNSNFFDSHDAAVVSGYIPDSVHPNEEGYDVLARHIAAELLRLRRGISVGGTVIDPAREEERSVSGNSAETEDVSGNELTEEEEGLSGEEEGLSEEEEMTDGEDSEEGLSGEEDSENGNDRDAEDPGGGGASAESREDGNTGENSGKKNVVFSRDN